MNAGARRSRVYPSIQHAAQLAEQPTKQTGDQRQDLVHEQIADPHKHRLENGTKVDHGSISTYWPELRRRASSEHYTRTARWEHPIAFRRPPVLTVRVMASVRKRRTWLDRSEPSSPAIVESPSTGASPLGVPSALDGGAEGVLSGGNPAILPNRSLRADATKPPTLRTGEFGFLVEVEG